MGKKWLKSVDPNRQCCGCEGKTGPCDSCCTRLVVTPTSNLIFPPLSQPTPYKSLERYYSNKIYSSSFDSWSVTNNLLTFDIDSPEIETPYHTNKLSISLNEGQELILNLNSSLSCESFPANLNYSSSQFTLSYGAGVSNNFNLGLAITNEDPAQRISIDTDIPGYSPPFTNNGSSLNFNYELISNQSYFEIEGALADSFSEFFCLNGVFTSYFGPNLIFAPDSQVQEAINAQFTISRVLIFSQEKTAVWNASNGTFDVTSGAENYTCDEVSGLLDSPPTFGGQSVTFFLAGYQFDTSGDVIPVIPPNPPHGATYVYTRHVYLMVYHRPIELLTKTEQQSYTMRITALKPACLTFTLDGALSERPNSVFPNAKKSYKISGSLSSESKINVLTLDIS